MLAVIPRRPGPWRLLELFTLTCMVTILGFQRGWDTYEPITMPGWDLSLLEMRAKARDYLLEDDPDFAALSPPRGSWDRIREHSQRTPWYTRELQRKKAEARAVLV